MGCTKSQPREPEKALGVRYAAAGLNQPFSVDYENEFEKDVFMAINLLRHNPHQFIVQVQRVHQKGLVSQSKAMAPLIEKLKQCKPMSTIRYDDQSNVAVRSNNDDIIGRAEASPAEGGNLSKLREVLN